MGQPTQHQPRHRYIDERLTGSRLSLIVFAEAAVLAQPPQRALDNPALGQHMKAAEDARRLLSWRHPDASEASPPMLDDLHVPLGQLLDCPGAEAAIVAAVGPQLTDVWKSLGHAVENQNCTVPVGH